MGFCFCQGPLFPGLKKAIGGSTSNSQSVERWEGIQSSTMAFTPFDVLHTELAHALANVTSIQKYQTTYEVSKNVLIALLEKDFKIISRMYSILQSRGSQDGPKNVLLCSVEWDLAMIWRVCSVFSRYGFGRIDHVCRIYWSNLRLSAYFWRAWR